MASTGNRGRSRSVSGGRGRRLNGVSAPMRTRLMATPGRDSSNESSSPRRTARVMPRGGIRRGTARVMVPQNRLLFRQQQQNGRRAISPSSGTSDEDEVPPSQRTNRATPAMTRRFRLPVVDLDDSRLQPGNETYMRDSFVTSDGGEIDTNSDRSLMISDDTDDEDRIPWFGGRNVINRETGSSDFDDLSDDSESSADEPPTAPDPDDASVIRSSEHGQCTICFEDAPYDPVGCLICRQLIGCRKCIEHWYHVGIKKRADHIQDAKNHSQCPLCRHQWESQPEIDSIFVLD